jgi:hypothetical protein
MMKPVLITKRTHTARKQIERVLLAITLDDSERKNMSEQASVWSR